MLFAKVSIIMPVYNGGNYFRLALESALRQTANNVEIVVVNDGSTDGGATDAIAKAYGDRIKYIPQENRGVAGALNTAIANMTGEFFAWLSHDDIYLPHKIESQLKYFDRLGNKDAMLFSDYELIGPSGESIAVAQWSHKDFVNKPMLPLYRGMINGCTIFIPRHILHEFGPFDEALRHTQDYDLWNRILAKYEFFHQPEVLIQYRVHPGQDSHKPEAAIEGDALWIRMLDSRTEADRVGLSGSSHHFLTELASFLDNTPYKKAAQYAHQRAAEVIGETLVSVVIPFFNECDLACRAARSVLDQTHPRMEVILVDDGSTEDLAPIDALVRADDRVRLIRQSNCGPGSARNHGMHAARGSYIAFLDADDVFLPVKVQRQLELMQRKGSVISHTSYYVRFPECGPELGFLNSGTFTGKVYPQIIAGCPIATPTVMIHRTLVAAGFQFPVGMAIGEDTLAWIELTASREILGIAEPLTIVEWSSASAPLNLQKSLLELSNVADAIEKHPLFSRQRSTVAQLRRTMTDVARRWRAAGGKNAAVPLNQAVVAAAFGTS